MRWHASRLRSPTASGCNYGNSHLVEPSSLPRVAWVRIRGMGRLISPHYAVEPWSPGKKKEGAL